MTRIPAGNGGPGVPEGQLECRTGEAEASLARLTAELHQCQERFRLLADMVDDVFWVGDFTTRKCIYVNPACEAVLGRSVEELQGESIPFHDVLHREDWETVQDIVVEAWTRGKPYECGFRVVWPDGSVRWLRERAFPVLDSAGNKEFMAGFCTDVTSVREAQEEATHLRETLDAAQRLAHIGYWRYDMASATLSWSDHMFEVCGRRREEGVPSYEEQRETWHPDDQALFDVAVEAYASGSPYSVVIRVLFPDRSWHHIRTQGFPIYAVDGSTKEFFGVSQDVTHLHRTGFAIAEACPDTIFLLDTDFRVTYVNHIEDNMTRSDVTGKQLWTVVEEKQQSEVRQALKNALETGQPGRFSTMHDQPGGRRATLESCVVRIVLPDGQPGLVVSSRDVTEHTLADQKTREQLDELKRWREVMLKWSDHSQELKHEVNTLLRRLGEPIRYLSQEAP